jgi:hypothetical protein
MFDGARERSGNLGKSCKKGDCRNGRECVLLHANYTLHLSIHAHLEFLSLARSPSTQPDSVARSSSTPCSNF